MPFFDEHVCSFYFVFMRRPVASGVLGDFATRVNGISVHEIFPCVLCFPSSAGRRRHYSQLGSVAIRREIAL